jgi:hypothetical protein
MHTDARLYCNRVASLSARLRFQFAVCSGPACYQRRFKDMPVTRVKFIPVLRNTFRRSPEPVNLGSTDAEPFRRVTSPFQWIAHLR